MAISWLTVLKSVPWNDVISNAPKIADGAKKLLRSIGKKSGSGKDNDIDITNAAKSQGASIADMHIRVTTMEARMDELQNQLLQSAEILKQLSEQNAELIKRIEVNRIRSIWLGVITTTAMLIALANLIFFIN